MREDEEGGGNKETFHSDSVSTQLPNPEHTTHTATNCIMNSSSINHNIRMNNCIIISCISFILIIITILINVIIIIIMIL